MYKTFVYLPIYQWLEGSCYKYYTLLMQNYGGIKLDAKTPMAQVMEYRADIGRIKPDLIFCHGDWMGYYRTPLKMGIPYVLFEHDIHTLRMSLTHSQMQQEKQMIEGAAGIIFTSEDHLDYCIKTYPNMTKNFEVIYLRPMKQDVAFKPLPKLPGKNLVYAGGLVTPSSRGGNYGYRAYTEIFKDFMKAGWIVHLYGNGCQGDLPKSFEKSGCVVHDWLPYGELLKDMSKYTAGLQSYNKEGVPELAFQYTQTCRPNKTWDYLAANIPTIGLYAGNCAKIYTQGGWGIEIPDTKEETLDNINLPEFPDSLRFEQVIDNDLAKFDNVIQRALVKNPRDRKIQCKQSIKKQEGENVMRRVEDLWYRCEKAIIINGRVAYGKGKRIPKNEAVRLGLIKKEGVEPDKVDKLKKRLEDKASKKTTDLVLVENTLLKGDELDMAIDTYLLESENKRGKQTHPKGKRKYKK